MDRKYRIGVIGAGARGETFARQLYAGFSRAELFGICDIDADRLAKFCDYLQLKGASRFTDPQEFLSHPDLDAVVITTPEFTHKDVALAAMRAGKHIYCEKALAHTPADAREILHAHASSKVTAYVGFNLRAQAGVQKLKAVVESGVLGQIVQISGLEQLAAAHGAAFMRRYHRHASRSGGLLNTKCSHDLDLMQWLIGYEHKIVRVASFGGSNVFRPDKQPAERCTDCRENIRRACPYRDRTGFVFPVSAREGQPFHKTEQTDVYGGDLCVYHSDKDLVDNQTLIMEWDHGVRGNFNLQMFQAGGRRETCIWGENGYAELTERAYAEPSHEQMSAVVVRVVASATGDVTEYHFAKQRGGHGGADIKMIDRFIDAIENPLLAALDSGLSAGLAATLVASKADEARLSGTVVTISPKEYL